MIQPLIEITGVIMVINNQNTSHYVATCRDCGELDNVAMPQTATQASLIQGRHLAEHLVALANEITEAAR